MIFRTITDESTGATKSIGLLGKSITELKSIFSSIKAKGIINTFFNTSTIDTKAVIDYNAAIKEATANGATMAEKQQIMKTAMEDTNKATAQLIGSTKGAIVETEALTAAQHSSTLAAKAQAVALKAVSVAGNMILFAAITKGIELVVKGFDNWIHRVEKANEAMNDAVGEYESAKSSLESVNSELEEQNKKLNELLAKDKLTYAEKGQLEELQAITKELLLQQDIEEKRAANASKEVAEKTVDAYKKQYGRYDKTEDELKEKLSYEIFPMPEDGDDVLGMIAAYIRATELLEQAQKDYQDAVDNGKDTTWLAYNVQYNIDMVDDFSRALDDNISDLQEKRTALEDEYNKAVEKREAGLEPLTTYEKEVIDTYESIYDVMRMVYEYTDQNTWKSMQIESVFDTAGIEKTKEELIEMVKAGEFDESTLQSYPKLSAALEQNKVSASELRNELEALADAENNVKGDTFNLENPISIPNLSSSISTLATQLEPQFTKLGEAYNEVFQTDDNGNRLFSPDAVDNSMLEGLRKSFAEIEEEIGVTFDAEQLEPFFAVLTDGSSTTDEVQQAFNDLATAYLYSTGTLEQLNDETANAVKQQLKQMGVSNAEEVVTEALAVKNEELALSKKYLALEGKELAEATDTEVLAFMAEQAEAGNCSDALVALQLKKLLVNGTLLDTEADIQNVMRFAQSAGIATEALAELITLKAAYEKAEADGRTNTRAFSIIANRMKTLEQDFLNDANSYVNSFELDPVNIEFNTPDSSKSSASSSTAKQAETDWKNVLDKETDLLEKQLAANVITFREYTDKRRQIIEDYYCDGRIKAEDYYDALEAMYEYHLSIYDRVANAVTNRIDDEIDKLKDQKEAIEKSYQARIDAIQEEIDALNKANDARKAQIDLEKAQYEAERARNQRVNKVYNGEQFIYEADMDSVRDAEEDLADKEFQLNISRLETQIESLKSEMENATKSLDNQIDALEAYKDKWNEISDVYQKQQDKLLAAEVMGTEWERDILNGRLDTLRNFTEQYIALQQAQADAAVNAAKIKAEAEAGNAAGGNITGGNITGGGGNDDGGGDPQKYYVIYEGTAKTVRTFDTPEEAQSYANYMNKVHYRDEFIYYVKKYASGTKNARKGLNLVGEEGTETFIDNDGNVSLVTKPTLIPMEGGEVVKNAEETKELLRADNMQPTQSDAVKTLLLNLPRWYRTLRSHCPMLQTIQGQTIL